MDYWQRFLNDGTKEGKRSAFSNDWKLENIIRSHSMLDSIGRQDAILRGKAKAKTMPLDTLYYHSSIVRKCFDEMNNIPNYIEKHVRHTMEANRQTCWSTEIYGASYLTYTIKGIKPEVYFDQDGFSMPTRWPGREHLLTTWVDPENCYGTSNPQAEALNEAWITFSKYTKAERTLRLDVRYIRDSLRRWQKQFSDKEIETIISKIVIKLRTMCLRHGIIFKEFGWK